jgi:hypothetical protein
LYGVFHTNRADNNNKEAIIKMLVDFRPNKFDADPLKVIEDPYVEVQIRAKDHTNIYAEEFKSWSPSVSVENITWNGSNRVGLKPSSGSSSVNFTRTLTINDKGYYLIMIRGVRGPKDKNGKITLTIDSTNHGSKSTYNQWESWNQLNFGFIYLSSGSHDFTVNVTKNSYIGKIFLYKMDTYTTKTKHSNQRLDINTLEFTNNSVNEANIATLNMAMNPDWYVPEKNYYSHLVFDFTDHITIFLGEDRKTARPMFGGYLSGISMPEDPGTVEIRFMDRLMDLYRNPVYRNFHLGTAAKSNEDETWPLANFTSIQTLIRYLISTMEYPLGSYRVEYDYGFYLNFGDSDDYDQVRCTGFTKQWDPRTGNPAPGLKLKYGKLRVNSCGGLVSGAVEAVFFEDTGTPFDAVEYPILAFDYLASGVSSSYPVEFHVAVTMYREGETPDDAVEYIINFTGKTGESNIIGSVSPVLNGAWQSFKFDLKTAFDKKVPSSNYYVTKVRFKDTYTPSQLATRINSVMWIDNMCSYGTIQNVNESIDQGDSYPFDVIQAACEATNHVAYVDYAAERGEDVMVLAPISNKISDETAVEGVNVLKVYNKDYNPFDNLKNQALRHYHYPIGNDEFRTGKTMYENVDSIKRYGPWESYEDQSDETNKTNSGNAAKRFVEDNSYGWWDFSMDLLGTALVTPADYIVTSIPNHYLSGDSAVKAIIHTFDKDSSPQWMTQIDVGRESRRFKRLITKIKQDLLLARKRDHRTMYNTRSIKNLGNTSPGSFVRGVKK